MIRTAVLLILIGFACSACIQQTIFACKQSSKSYCPK